MSTTPIIIGIHGIIGSGKDTLAQMLSVQLQNKGYSCERIGFADALKREVATAIQSLDDDIEDMKMLDDVLEERVRWINDNKQHFRLILQGWGTDFRRQLHGENYWIDKWKWLVKESDAKIILTPDVRFQNEYDIIKSMHGLLVMIDRDNIKRGDHQSEQSLGHNVFQVILNDGTLMQLEAQARRFISVNGL